MNVSYAVLLVLMPRKTSLESYQARVVLHFMDCSHCNLTLVCSPNGMKTVTKHTEYSCFNRTLGGAVASSIALSPGRVTQQCVLEQDTLLS